MTIASRAWRCGALVVAGVVASGCSDAPGEVRADAVSRAVMGGVWDATSHEVVAVVSSVRATVCSGTLIAPNVVLTAQHCVAEASGGGSYVACRSDRFGEVTWPRAVQVTTDDHVSRSSKLYQVAEIVVPPGEGNRVCGYDIALLVLDEPIADPAVVPRVPRIDIPVRTNELLTAVGFGHIGNGYGAGERRRREGLNVLCVGVACNDSNAVDSREFLANGGVCGGDSGGPAIDSEGRVFGVAVREFDGCKYSSYSSVPDWRDLIIDTVKLAATRGGYPVPTWADLGTTLGPDVDLDGVPESQDNCVDVSNADQADRDGDGVGDACDPVDDRDRGGDCPVCNGCARDGDCGPGGLCRNLVGSPVCTLPCETDSDCGGNLGCVAIGVRKVCVNLDANDNGVCPAAFVCDTSAGVAPDECAVCRACNTDADCGVDGLCEDFGSGAVCTNACTVEAGCPGDARCVDVRGAAGQSVMRCLNPDAAAGVCAGAWACSGNPEDQEGSGSDGPKRSAGRDGGCAVAETGSAVPAFPFGLVALGLGLGRRRLVRAFRAPGIPAGRAPG